MSISKYLHNSTVNYMYAVTVEKFAPKSYQHPFMSKTSKIFSFIKFTILVLKAQYFE